MTLSARLGEGVDQRRQSISRHRSGGVIDQKMIRDQVRLHARNSLKLFECLDDGSLRRPAVPAGERQSRTLSAHGRFTTEKQSRAEPGEAGGGARPRRTT